MMKIITANSVADGRAVYLALHGVWSRRLAEGAVFMPADEGPLAEALASAIRDEGSVCGPYVIDVVPAPSGEGVVASSLREQIRAHGPTTGHSASPHFSRQSAQ